MQIKFSLIAAIIATLILGGCVGRVYDDPKLYCEIEEGMTASYVAKFLHNGVPPQSVVNGTNIAPEFVQSVADYMQGKPRYYTIPTVIATGQFGDQRVEITTPDTSPNADRNRQSRNEIQRHFTNECLKNGPRKVRDFM